MCLKPISVTPKGAGKHIPVKYNWDRPYRPLAPYEINTRAKIEVPCGKCLECMAKRHNSFAYRLYNQMQKHLYCYHFTLTYRPEKLPFAISVQTTDYETKKPFKFSANKLVEDKGLLEHLRLSYLFSNPSSSPVYIERFVKRIGDTDFEYVATPSLNRADVRSWIKTSRIYLKRRDIDVELFYSFCGEYGPKTCRPHYHCVVMSDQDLAASGALGLLKANWKSRFGNLVVKTLPRLNRDGTDAYQIASKYISKYISKGTFENPACVAGYCEKGRICQSQEKFLFSNSVKSYYYAYDLFGAYDINKFALRTGKYEREEMIFSNGERGYHMKEILRPFTKEQTEVLLDEIIKRKKLPFGVNKKTGEHYYITMPRLMEQYLFYFYDKNKKRYKRSRLSYLVADRVHYLQDQKQAELMDQLREKYGDDEEGVLLACKEFDRIRETALANRKQNRLKSYKKALRSSWC